MSGIINRPGLFAAMGPAFTSAFGNVDVTLTIDDEVQPNTARGILRQSREIDLMPESFTSVEGMTHTLSLSASDADGLQQDRDSVTIEAVTYAVRAVADDGRAMVIVALTGDI